LESYHSHGFGVVMAGLVPAIQDVCFAPQSDRGADISNWQLRAISDFPSHWRSGQQALGTIANAIFAYDTAFFDASIV
jgi:hypothetical protein